MVFAAENVDSGVFEVAELEYGDRFCVDALNLTVSDKFK